MKITTLLFTLVLITLSANGQNFTVQVTEGPCEGYELTIQGSILETNQNCEHTIDQGFAADGETVTLMANDIVNQHLNGMSTLDQVLMTRILLGENIEGAFGMNTVMDQNKAIYKSDIDLDGVVSTYDIVLMRANLIGLENEFSSPNNHLISPSTEIPTLDPFDIQVDYSKLVFDYQSNVNVIDVRVLKLGDLNNSGM